MNIDQYCKIMNQITVKMRTVNDCLAITDTVPGTLEVLRIDVCLANQFSHYAVDSDRLTEIYQTEDNSLDAESFLWLMGILYGGVANE